jgi:Icc protein
MTRVPGYLALLVVSSGCLNVADLRAERDAVIGSATADGVSVQVQDGLARVRVLEAGRIELWAGAPELVLQIEGPGGPLTLQIDNVLGDAELQVDGGTQTATRSVGARITQGVFHLMLPPGRTELRLVAPDRADLGRFRFAVFADVQERIDDVQDIFERINADPSLRFCLISGDLTEQGSPEELARFELELGQLNVPCYATLGNHELGNGNTNFHDQFGRGSASFVFRGVRFTRLDSGSATLAPQTHDWLDGWLQAGRDQAHLVMMHHPLLDPIGTRGGGFASRNEAHRILARLAAGHADLTIYGHVHSFYTFSNAGIPALIAGGGGAIPERLDGVGRHFVAIQVDPQTQHFEPALVRVD